MVVLKLLVTLFYVMAVVGVFAIGVWAAMFPNGRLANWIDRWL